MEYFFPLGREDKSVMEGVECRVSCVVCSFLLLLAFCLLSCSFSFLGEGSCRLCNASEVQVVPDFPDLPVAA